MFRKVLLFVLMISYSLPVGARKKISILGFETDSGLEKKAKMATKMFVKFARASSKLSVLPVKEIEEVKIEYCDEEKDSLKQCLIKISKELSADILITGRVTKQGKKVKISVSFLANGQLKYTYKVFPLSSSTKTYRIKIREIWYSYFKSMKSKVSINCNVAGAKVFIDGAFLFKTVPGTNEIPQITPGEHTVKVENEAGKIWTKTINIKSGASLTLNVKFAKKVVVVVPVKTKPIKQTDGTDIKNKPEEPAKPSKPLFDFSSGSKFWKGMFYGTVAVSAILIGGGIYSGIQVLGYEDDKDAILKGTTPVPDVYRSSDVCTGATGDLKGVCDDGKAAASRFNTLFISGAVLGVVSTFFLYKGFIAVKSEVSGSIETSDDAGTVSILPMFSSHGAGLSIGTKF
jgi:PEGA domain